MSDSAIHTDVQEVAEPQEPQEPAATGPKGEPEAKAPQKSAREIALEELEARHQQQMAAENGYKLEEVMAVDEPEPAPAEPAPTPAPAPAPATEQDQLQAQMAAGTPSELPSKIKIKVDGVEAEVPFDDVIRQYQKNSSADRRLAEATRLLREAQETAAQRLLQEQQRAAAAPANPAEPDPTPAPDPEREATGKEFLKALFEGDEEAALAKLNALTQAGRQQPPQVAAPAPTLDLEQISSAVAQHVQQKLVVESALARNRQDYPELYADPDIEGLALAKIQRMREESDMDFFAALDSVSREFAHKFGWNAAQQPGRPPADPVETTSPRTAKLERKTGIDNVASVNTKITTAEPQPENPSDIIAQMRAARAGGR